MSLAKDIQASTFPAFRSRTALGAIPEIREERPAEPKAPQGTTDAQTDLLPLLPALGHPGLCRRSRMDLECLQEAYPGFITATETDEAGHVWFLTKNGGRLLYDDGKMKSHAELLENADIEDAMRQPYPLEPERPDFAPDEEPGRIRCYPLLKALYGRTSVPWNGESSVRCSAARPRCALPPLPPKRSSASTRRGSSGPPIPN